MTDKPPTFDPSTFTNDPYVTRVEKPWGYELHWVRGDAPYMGKVLHINAGARLSLQLHDAKRESWLLVHGRAKVLWDDNQSDMVETELQPRQGYSTRLPKKERRGGSKTTPPVDRLLRLIARLGRASARSKGRRAEAHCGAATS